MIENRESLFHSRQHNKDLTDPKFAVQSLDFSGTVLDVSPGWQRLTGYDRDEVLGRHFMEFLAKESLFRVHTCFPKLKDFATSTTFLSR